MTTPPDPFAEFSVSATDDGQLTLDHNIRVDVRHYCWTLDIGNSITLPELIDLARKHLADEHPEETL